MVQNGITGVICYSIFQYEKVNNKHMGDYDKNKDSSYLQYWRNKNLYGWAMSKKLLVNNFEWIKHILNLMKISSEI